jgi:hypothetical protein
MGKRTRVQVERPHIIQELSVDLATKDEELGTDHCHSMAVTTDGSGTIRHDAGPLSRYWSVRNCNQLEPVLISKSRRTKIEKIKGIILGLIWHLLAACIRVPAPNQKDAADECAGMSDTWAGNLSTGLQESSR